jgi:hypothetical protein
MYGHKLNKNENLKNRYNNITVPYSIFLLDVTFKIRTKKIPDLEVKKPPDPDPQHWLYQ